MGSSPVTLTNPDQWMQRSRPQPSNLTDPDAWMAKLPKTDTQPGTLQDALSKEGFVDSAWGAIKSMLTPMGVQALMKSDVGLQDARKAMQLDKDGTDEQRRQFTKELLLKNIPLASTVYKLYSGNLGGAAGDVLPGLALGEATTGFPLTRGVVAAAPDLAKAGAVYGVAKAVPGAGPLVEGLADLKGLQLAKNGLQKGAAAAKGAFRNPLEAMPPAPPVATGPVVAPAPAAPVPPRALLTQGDIITPPPPNTPGIGQSYVRAVPAQYAQPEPITTPSRLLPQPATPIITPPPPDASFVRAVPAQYATVEGSVAPPPVEPPAAPTAPPVEDLKALDDIAIPNMGKPFAKLPPPLQDLVRTLAKRVQAGETAAPAASPVQPVAAAPPPAPAPAAPASSPAPEMVDQPPVTEAPRSQYTANGDKKSPQLRGAEIKAANEAAKGERLAPIFRDSYGITSENAGQIPMQRVSDADMSKGATPGWPNIFDDMKTRGLVSADETAPNGSIPHIIRAIKKLEDAAPPAKQ